MEAVVTAALTSVSSALIVGVVMTNYKKKVDESAHAAHQASNLKTKLLEDKITSVALDLVAVKARLELLIQQMVEIDKKVTIIQVNQEHENEKFDSIGQQVSFLVNERINHGKVVVK